MPYLKMLWTTESPTPQIGSWDYWMSVSGTLFSVDGIPLVKTNNKIAYYGYYEYQGDLIPLIISPDEQAVYTSYNGSTFNRSDGSVTDVNGITWYYSICGGNVQGSSIDKNCQVPELEPWGTPPEDAANTILDYLWSIKPHKEFTPWASNPVNYFANPHKTIRVALGLLLTMTLPSYSPQYNYGNDAKIRAISDNIEAIISYIETYLPYDVIAIGVNFSRVITVKGVNSIKYLYVGNKTTSDGFTRYEGSSTNYSAYVEITPDTSGNISYYNRVTSISGMTDVGLYTSFYRPYRGYFNQMRLSNVEVDL